MNNGCVHNGKFEVIDHHYRHVRRLSGMVFWDGVSVTKASQFERKDLRGE